MMNLPLSPEDGPRLWNGKGYSLQKSAPFPKDTEVAALVAAMEKAGVPMDAGIADDWTDEGNLRLYWYVPEKEEKT